MPAEQNRAQLVSECSTPGDVGAEINPKLHRERGVLEAKGVWWEPSVKPTKAGRVTLECAVKRLAAFVGARTIAWGAALSRKSKDPLPAFHAAGKPGSEGRGAKAAAATTGSRARRPESNTKTCSSGR